MYFTLRENKAIKYIDKDKNVVIAKELGIPLKQAVLSGLVDQYTGKVYNSSEINNEEILLGFLNGNHINSPMGVSYWIEPIDPRYIQYINGQIKLIGAGLEYYRKTLVNVFNQVILEVLELGVIVNNRRYASTQTHKIALTNIIRDINEGRYLGIDYAFYDMENREVDLKWHIKEDFDILYQVFFDHEKELNWVAIASASQIKHSDDLSYYNLIIKDFFEYIDYKINLKNHYTSPDLIDETRESDDSK